MSVTIYITFDCHKYFWVQKYYMSLLYKIFNGDYLTGASVLKNVLGLVKSHNKSADFVPYLEWKNIFNLFFFLVKKPSRLVFFGLIL